MDKSTKLTATALATLLACAPVGAFAWTGSQSNASPEPSQATNQTEPAGGMQGSQQLSRNTVAQVQQKLQQDGFYRGGHVDGVMGPKTHTALMDFQRSKGLTANGQLDNQTLAALGANQQRGSAPNAGAPSNG